MTLKINWEYVVHRFYKNLWIGKISKPVALAGPWAFAKSTTPTLFSS